MGAAATANPSQTHPFANIGLNALEKALQGAHKIETLVEQILSPNINADAVQDDPQNLHAGILGDLAAEFGDGAFADDVKTAIDVLKAKYKDPLVDDKTYLMERVIALAARLPPDSKNKDALTQQFISQLWDNLRHPPLSYLGDEWKYRTADGSNNNRLFPHLGRAGSSYAQTVKPKIQLSPVQPDPGLVFDELFAREGKAKTHPNEISSMLFYMASIIIHDIFRTDELDPTKVNSSSYLDLAPLYGNNLYEQGRVRRFQDGLLHPDTFSEVRLIGFPPGVASLLVCFNRYHNWVATQLAEINEGGRFDVKPYLTPDERDMYGSPEGKRDNDLFQTARLVTCGLYVNIILIDYVRTILNLNRTHSEWSLDPRANYGNVFGPTGTPEGIGNQVSVEFNLIYRWHSTISERDEEWTQNFFLENTGGLDPSTCKPDELGAKFAQFLIKLHRQEPSKLEFGGMKRDSEGRFKDEELIQHITSGTDDVAAAFGARNVPKVMRAIEMMGIQQARNWNVATLNEVRQYFGLRPYEKFSDINADPSVQSSLETLYRHVDHVEFYPGIVAEDAKEPRKPGSGLCPGYTISKAILSDAVALVRGDRFYTENFDARYLTNWGWTEVQSNKQVAGGGVIYKLLMRSFKSWYKGNSVFALYPFTPAKTTRKIMEELGTADLYDYSKPALTPVPTSIVSAKGVKHVLGNHTDFKVPWGPHTYEITGHDFMLSGDKESNRAQHREIKDAIFEPEGFDNELKILYETVTMDMIKQHMRPLRKGNQIDMVADVANLSHATAVAKLFRLPLKTADHREGLLTAPAFYTAASVLFAYVFLDVDPASDRALYLAAKTAAEGISAVVKQTVSSVQNGGWPKPFAMLSNNEDRSKDIGTALIERLSAGGKNADEVTAAILPTIAGAVPTQAQGISQVLDLFFSDKYHHHWPKIQKLAKSDSPDDFERLRKYGLEAMRLATPAFGVFRKVDAIGVEIPDGSNGTIKPKKGDIVFADFVQAGMDKECFPNPEEINLDRPDHLYLHHGFGSHRCIGRRLAEIATASQLKILGKLKNLRRAPGPAGQLKFRRQQGFKVYMKPDWSSDWPFPTTMKFCFDDIDES